MGTATELAAPFQRLAGFGRGMSRHVARATIEFVGREEPLARFLAQAPESVVLAWAQARRMEGLAGASPGADPVVADLAAELYLFVLSQARTAPGPAGGVGWIALTPADLLEVELELVARIGLLVDGPDGFAALGKRAARLAERQAAERAGRLAQKPPKRGFDATHQTVRTAVAQILRAQQSSFAVTAVRAYVERVPPGGHAWETIARSIHTHQRYIDECFAKITAAGGWDAFGDGAARTMLGPASNPVKGTLGEMAWWASRACHLRISNLLRTGVVRGRRLARADEGRTFTPVVVPQPLLLNGKELFDGSVLLVRPLESGSHVQVFEGFMHAAFQVQSRLVSSLPRVADQDVLRQLRASVSGLTLAGRDGDVAFVIRPPKDGHKLIRYLIGPDLVGMSKPVPINDRTVYLASEFTAQEISEVCFAILRQMQAGRSGLTP